MNKNIDVITATNVEDIPRQLEAAYIHFIQNRVGIKIKHNQRELQKAIHAACKKFNITADVYLAMLKLADDNSEVLSHLVSAITIGETYFFRDKHQVKILFDTILPAIIRQKRTQNQLSLRIWSAGCSSGEEIYTIVMMLNKLIGNLDGWQCHFLATDINIDVLKKGINGEYSDWSMRAIPEEYLKKYFTHLRHGYQLSRDISKHVTFEYLNLVNDAYPTIMNGTTMIDLVICRNVLIYFDNEHIKLILARLAKCVAPDGYIMLGASDPTAMLNTDIVTADGMPSVFRKKKNNEPRQQLKEEVITQSFQDIPLSGKHMYQVETDLPKPPYEDIVVSKPTPAMLTAKAISLANLGKTQEAIEVCKTCLSFDKMNKEAYFTYALLLAESQQWKEAETAFRRALYIDKNYLICRYQFGLFLLHLHRHDEGIKSLNNTIQSATKFDEDAIVPNSQNISYKQLIIILQKEIELHQ